MECDFAFHGLGDFRDAYLPGGGPSKLTIRRVLLLVRGLRNVRSMFWDEVEGRDRLTHTETLLVDIFGSLTGQKHPIADIRRHREQAIKRAEAKARIKRREAARKRREEMLRK